MAQSYQVGVSVTPDFPVRVVQQNRTQPGSFTGSLAVAIASFEREEGRMTHSQFIWIIKKII